MGRSGNINSLASYFAIGGCAITEWRPTAGVKELSSKGFLSRLCRLMWDRYLTYRIDWMMSPSRLRRPMCDRSPTYRVGLKLLPGLCPYSGLWGPRPGHSPVETGLVSGRLGTFRKSGGRAARRELRAWSPEG